MIITITLNPAMDRTLRIEQPLQVNILNRHQHIGRAAAARESMSPVQSKHWAARASHLAFAPAATDAP